MFKHILVPLDGSRLAESVLGIVTSLARRFEASVTLLHLIVETLLPRFTAKGTWSSRMRLRRTWMRSLICRSWPAEPRSTHVHTLSVSDVAESIRGHLKAS